MLPERPDNSEMTLRQVCRWRRIPLDDAQRSVIGIGISKRAAQRQSSLRTVEERLDSGFKCRSRVYPLKTNTFSRRTLPMPLSWVVSGDYCMTVVTPNNPQGSAEGAVIEDPLGLKKLTAPIQ